jgi:hypothetical protein
MQGSWYRGSMAEFCKANVYHFTEHQHTISLRKTYLTQLNNTVALKLDHEQTDIV